MIKGKVEKSHTIQIRIYGHGQNTLTFGHGQLSNTQHYEYQIHCTRQIRWTYDRYVDWTYDQYSKESRQGQIDTLQPRDRQRRHRQANGHLSIIQLHFKT